MKRWIAYFFLFFSIAFLFSQLSHAKVKKAIFAGGCFWCMESPFDHLDGVLSTTVGYSGGAKETANYKAVSTGRTKHVEAIQIEYEDSKVSYAKLLEIFWKQIDPTDIGGQFADRGPQYQTGIYYFDEEQHSLAKESKQRLQNSKRFPKDIVVPIQEATSFFPAEGYHQNYYKKNPLHYKMYKNGSGRQRYIDKYWKD